VTVTVPAFRSAATIAPVWHAGRRAAVTAGPDDLTLEACVVPWHTAARVTDDGRTFYTETWSPGSLVPEDRVVIYDGHVPGGGGDGQLNPDRQPIGRADTFTERPDGLYATLRLANTSRGRDVYELARVLGFVNVSLEADVPVGGTGTVARTAATPCPLTGIAVVLPPGTGAFPGAVAAAGRAAGDEDDDQADDDDTEETEANPDIEPDAPAGRAAVGELVRAELARYGMTPGRRPSGRTAGPLARFANFREFVTAARAAEGDRAAELRTAFAAAYQKWRELDRLAATGTVGRALLDQVTVDNPGLMPPSWLTEVFGIVDRGRPSITALGGPRNPGDAGMDVYWPYYDGDLLAIVAEQTAEKAAINSVKVSFKRGQATLDTYAGGSDVSYQLQRRSSPSYMALYDRILQIAYGLTTEVAFATVLSAVDAAPDVYDLAADTDGSALRAILFGASTEVRNVTGEPASVALAATDVFIALGGAPWLMPPAYGTQNISGTAQASTLAINISGLVITESPGLPAGTMIVTNPGAAAWFEEGPFIVTAEDVEKLGTNVAIWGMGTAGVFLPAGVVEITVTLPAPLVAATKRSAAK